MRTIQTRLLLLKKQWMTLLFWLVFPLLITWVALMILSGLEMDAQIPVGLVIEEDSLEVSRLVERIKASDMLTVYEYDEEAALQALVRHELDSVFIINEGYQEKLQNNQRKNAITGYKSNLSFTYMPVKEMLVAFVQKDAGSAKAVEVVQQLQIENNIENLVTWEEVSMRADDLEDEARLLASTLSFAGEKISQKAGKSSFINPFNVWVIALTLATFFVFDWIIREKNAAAAIRLQFTRKSLKVYLIEHFLVYTVILVGFDVLSLFALSLLFDLPQLSLTKVIAFGVFRIILNLTVLLVAVHISKLSLYYALAIIFSLFLVVTSTAILPIEHMYKRYTWLYLLNPLQPLMHNDIAYVWLIAVAGCLVIWFIRKGENHA